LKNKLVQGVGINDANYAVQLKEHIGYINGKQIQKVIWTCPYYTKWHKMIQRAYSPKIKLESPSYQGVVVCEEWLTFSNFKSWMETQAWEGKHLDKDIIKQGNKIYCPEFCAFVTQETNKFVLDSAAARGDYPLGVYLHKHSGKLMARIKTKGQTIYLGSYTCPNEAHKAWRKAKHELAVVLAEQQDDLRIAHALKTRWLEE
jgi:hypothetical protein